MADTHCADQRLHDSSSYVCVIYRSLIWELLSSRRSEIPAKTKRILQVLSSCENIHSVTGCSMRRNQMNDQCFYMMTSI